MLIHATTHSRDRKLSPKKIKMNKYIQSILLFGIVLIFESIPFLYKESFDIIDMKWGWIIGLPIILLIRNIYEEGKAKNEEGTS